MTFLAPAALFGLALLAIPVVVHLFKPRRVRQTPFSSLRWLHLTQQRMARRIQWHQVLLFLLRASFVTLLVLALARPLLSPKGTGGTRDSIVVIDVSRSMGRQLEGRPRPIEAARKLAAETLRTLQPGDRAAVLLTGAKTTVLAPWTSDAAQHIAALESLEPGPSATNLDSSLDSIRALLDLRRANASADVTFLTDNTSGSWTPGAIASFAKDVAPEGENKVKSVELRLIDVSLPTPENGWLAAARLRDTEMGPVLHVEGTCVGESQRSRTLTVKGLTGVEPLSTEMLLEPGRITSLDLPLPATFERRGSRARLQFQPKDELPDDDEFYADLDTAGARRVLFIEPESGGDETQAAGFALRTALRALADAGAESGDASIVVRTPAAVTSAEIEASDIVVLSDVPGLTAALAETLTHRVLQGAGVAFFLGPRVEPEVYNQRFLQPLKVAEGLLPASLGGPTQASAAAGGLAPWKNWDARHPLVQGLLDPLLGDLAQTRSRTWLRLVGEIPAGDDVVVRTEDGTAAVVARRVGAGRVLLVNATSDDRWCDLPRHKSFVPVVDRMMTYLSTAGRGRTFAAGEAITLSLPADFGADVEIRTPTGDTLIPRIESTPTGTTLRLDAASEPGFCTVTPKVAVVSTTAKADAANTKPTDAGSRSLTFVVQPSRDDSTLAAMDAETLRSWWNPTVLDIVKPTTATAALSAAGDERQALEPWLLMAACGVLLLEMFFVHWLCPRVNPALAASHGHRRGFVAPLRMREEAS